MRVFLSIDIGGTRIKTGLVEESGALLTRGTMPLPGDWEEFTAAVEQQFAQANAQHPVAGVAIASPGIVNPATGTVAGMSARTVDFIMGQPFYSLRQRLGVPVWLEQDANCAVLGEYWQGNARGLGSAMALVLGAGLGGGVLLNGRIHRGAHLLGGDVGYICPSANHNEDRLSTHLSPISAAAKYTRQTGRTLTLPEMHAARETDPVAASLYDQWLGGLSVLILTMHYTLDPEVFLLGGGISEWELLCPEVQRKLEELSCCQYCPQLPMVRPCLHRNSANLLGAVYALLLGEKGIY